MKYFVTLAAIVFLFWGCGKDSFETRPTLKYKSANGTIIPKDGLLKLTLTLTDKEGDIQDSIYIEKVTKNCALGNFKSWTSLPTDVPLTSMFSGDLIITYANGSGIRGYEQLSIAPKCSQNDTCYFRFMVKDKANNKSDTIQSEVIVLQYE